MPWSSGSFTRTDGTRTGGTIWQQARDAAVKIVALGHDTHDQDIADGINSTINKDGSNAMTGNFDAGSNKLTLVAAATLRTDSPNAGQVQDGSLNWVDGGGTADAITATYSPVIAALVDGQLCFVRATAANATTTPTFKPNGTTAHTIVKTGGVALVASDIVGDGHELILRYDLANTQWELLNPGSATGDMTAATYDPAAIAEQLVGLTAAQTLTNKQMTTIELGAAADTTLSRASAGNMNIEGNLVYRVGGTDVSVADGGTGASTHTENNVLIGEGASAISSVAPSTLGNTLTSDGTDWISDGPTTLTAEQALSGATIDFTSIPAGVKEITILVEDLSSDGTSLPMVQLGDAGGFEASGYLGSILSTAFTTGFGFQDTASAAVVIQGVMTIRLKDAANFTWVANTRYARTDSAGSLGGGGSKSLSAELTQVRLTFVNGTDEFDGGSAAIQYKF